MIHTLKYIVLLIKLNTYYLIKQKIEKSTQNFVELRGNLVLIKLNKNTQINNTLKSTIKVQLLFKLIINIKLTLLIKIKYFKTKKLLF